MSALEILAPSTKTSGTDLSERENRIKGIAVLI